VRLLNAIGDWLDKESLKGGDFCRSFAKFLQAEFPELVDRESVHSIERNPIGEWYHRSRCNPPSNMFEIITFVIPTSGVPGFVRVSKQLETRLLEKSGFYK
jgi:hypothetical protein